MTKPWHVSDSGGRILVLSAIPAMHEGSCSARNGNSGGQAALLLRRFSPRMHEKMHNLGHIVRPFSVYGLGLAGISVWLP